MSKTNHKRAAWVRQSAVASALALAVGGFGAEAASAQVRPDRLTKAHDAL